MAFIRIIRRSLLVAVVVLSVAMMVSTAAIAEYTLGPGGRVSQQPSKADAAESDIADPPLGSVQDPATSQPAAVQQQTQSASVKTACSKLIRSHGTPLFKDLKAVALYVEISPGKLTRALECHGREQDCAAQEGMSIDSVQRQQYIKYYEAAYRNYPAPIRRDQLVSLFKQRISQEILPFVSPDHNCQPSGITEIDEKTLGRIPETPSTLTVMVKLDVIDTTHPPIGVLTTHFYRPDSGYASFLAQMNPSEITAIPLDLPEAEISAAVAQFVGRLMALSSDPVTP